MDSMENVYLTVILLLLCELCAVKGNNCQSGSSETLPNGSQCKEIVADNGYVCYSHKHATVLCNNGFELQEPSTFECSSSEKNWKPSIPDNLCASTATTLMSKPTTQPQTTSTKDTLTSTESDRNTNNRTSATTSTKQSRTTVTKRTPSSTGADSINDNRTPDSTSESTSKTHTSAKPSSGSTVPDGGDSVVAAVVSVSVLTAIAIAAVIAFLLWRRRRLKSIPTMKIYSGTSLTNRNYEDGHGLDVHANDLVDREYAEVASENLHPDETAGNVYQTIDSLPEDQTKSNDGYGHLKMQTTQFIDKNYSHVPVNQTNVTAMADITYAHTNSAINEKVLNDNQVDVDTTYNRLGTSPKTSKGKDVTNKEEEESNNAEIEYNHAKAGLAELTSENKADTYSHLNTASKIPLEYPRKCLKINTQNSKMQNQEIEPHEIVTEHGIRTYESLNNKADNTIPEYAECMHNGEECGRLQQVSPDGYETAVGTSHNYFKLEPENEPIGPSSNEASFRVVEDNSEKNANNSVCQETPYDLPYFTLEKTEN